MWRVTKSCHGPVVGAPDGVEEQLHDAHAGVLEAMREHFAAPPPAVLDAWDPLAALDAPKLDPEALVQGARPATLHRLLVPPPHLAEAVRIRQLLGSSKQSVHAEAGMHPCHTTSTPDAAKGMHRPCMRCQGVLMDMAVLGRHLLGAHSWCVGCRLRRTRMQRCMLRCTACCCACSLTWRPASRSQLPCHMPHMCPVHVQVLTHSICHAHMLRMLYHVRAY